MIDNLNRIIRKDELQIRKIANQYYLTFGSNCYEINVTGAIVVNMVGNNISITDLSKRIGSKFNFTDVAQIESDINEFIDFLFNEALIEYV